MTRAARIIELDLLLQELRAEERIAEWLAAHPAATVRSHQYAGNWMCMVENTQSTSESGVRRSASGNGATEADARAQAFSVVFANEFAAKAEPWP